MSITVSNDAKFNDWADFAALSASTPSDPNHDPSMHEPVITGLDRMRMAMGGFDQPIAPVRALGDYAYPQANEFDNRMRGFDFSWGSPAMGKGVGEVGAAVVTSALDAVGSLFEAAAPKKLEIAEKPTENVQLSSLSDAMNGLSRAERYKQEVVQSQPTRKSGHDYG